MGRRGIMIGVPVQCCMECNSLDGPDVDVSQNAIPFVPGPPICYSHEVMALATFFDSHPHQMHITDLAPNTKDDTRLGLEFNSNWCEVR